MDKIKNRIQEHYNIAVEKGNKEGYQVVGVFLQGSQNYHLHYENSDIDSKAIVLPTFQDMLFNKPLVSTTFILDNNEHIDLKDIRLMFNCFRKQNINFLEILFTQYKVLNPDYENLFLNLMNEREIIARYDNYTAINCMAGMAMEKYVALEHPYPSLIDKIEKFGYDPKQLHHILRLREFLERYIQGEYFGKCLISNQKEYLINVKRGYYNLDEARILAKVEINRINQMKQIYKANYPLVINKEVDSILDATLLQIMRRYIAFNQ